MAGAYAFGGRRHWMGGGHARVGAAGYAQVHAPAGGEKAGREAAWGDAEGGGVVVRRARQVQLQQEAMRRWLAAGSLSGMPLLTYGNK